MSFQICFAAEKWDPPHPVLTQFLRFPRFAKIIVGSHAFLRIVKTSSKKDRISRLDSLTFVRSWEVVRSSDFCFFGEIRTQTQFLGPWRHIAGLVFS